MPLQKKTLEAIAFLKTHPFASPSEVNSQIGIPKGSAKRLRWLIQKGVY